MKKDKEIKIVYHYIEPKTEEESQEAERRLDAAFDVLFEIVERKNNKKLIVQDTSFGESERPTL
jgi:hypothetical protein